MKATKTVSDINQRPAISNFLREGFVSVIEEVEDYAIILLDSRGVVSTWNKGAEKIQGYRPDEIIGKSFKVFYSIEDQLQDIPELLLNQAVVAGRVSQEGW